MNIEEKVKKLISEKLAKKPDEIRREAALVDDLGADSLAIVELIMTMEDEFDIEVSDEEAEALRTVGDVIEYLEKKTTA